jgi:ubiquinol oxidase
VLETVAAVPGVVGAAFRHLRSLRRMEKDHGWIPALQEEAENERMHLLIFLAIAKPSALERFLIVCAQAAYGAFYAALYSFSGQSAHRMVGYLEEEAHLAYTAFLGAIDAGKIPNKPAPEIAIRYYGLPADARLRDVVLRVRADECMHRDFNHMLADKVRNNEANSHPHFMSLAEEGYTGRG